MRKMIVDERYFNGGDYTEWYRNSWFMGTYKEWLEQRLKPQMKEFDQIELFEDGTLYGIKGNVSKDLSYNEFDDPKIFDEIAEEFGYEIIDDAE